MCVIGSKCVRFNWHLKMSPKRLYDDLVLKRKVIVCAGKHGNRAVGRISDVSEANICCWRNERIPYFLARQQQNALEGLRNEDSPK